MTLIDKEISFKGQLVKVKFEDDLPWGEIEIVLNSCFSIKMNGTPDIKWWSYLTQMAAKTIKTDVFNVNDPTTFSKQMGRKEIMSIADVVFSAYPIGDFLEVLMKGLLGNDFQEQNSQQATTLTMPAQEDLSGQ